MLACVLIPPSWVRDAHPVLIACDVFVPCDLGSL
jgi:hypothetical protein